MDNITHALAGLLLADATTAWVAARTAVPSAAAESETPRRSPTAFQKTAAVLGIAAAELPDADLLYSGPVVGMGKLGYLLHHRGHTHTLLFALLSAVALWAIALQLHRWRHRRRGEAVWSGRERSALLVLAVVGTLSHLLLDFTNNYGVHPFWPLDNRWYYGDAVFIVEPWLWVVAIPPLFWGARTRWGRVLLGVLLLAIMAAAWLTGQLPPTLAMLVTGGALLWTMLHWWVARRRPGAHTSHNRQPALPVVLGLMAWFCVESTFFAATARAHRISRGAVPTGTFADVVLTPGAANPLCLSAIVVTYDGIFYRTTTATVAPLPALRTAAACAAEQRDGRFGVLRNVEPATFSNAADIVWSQTWSSPRNVLVALAAERCEFAAALRYMRVPVWDERPNGSVHLADLRYGVSGNGFAELDIAPFPTPCTLSRRAWIPGWAPPRQDIIEGVLR